MAVTIAETSGHVTETELKSPLSPPVTMRRNDRSHSPKYAEFVALPLTRAAQPQSAPASEHAGLPRDIRVEVRRNSSTITVNWPLEDAPSCAAWLREWLR